MKTEKRLKIIVILLFVAVLVFASFFGVYKKEDYRTVNIINNFKLGMHFTDKLKITGTPKKDTQTIIYDSEGNIVVDDGETEYSEENGYTTETINLNEKDLTLDNYKQVKKIIAKRLRKMGVGEYNISLDKKTGEITVVIQDNDDAEEAKEHATQVGKFSVIDKETEEELITHNEVKSCKIVYGASKDDPETTVIYLQINFNKEGAKKLEEISQIYVESKTEEETEDGEMEEVDNTRHVSIKLDDDTLSSTYFGEKMSTGVLYVPVTQAKDTETLTTYITEMNKIATVINTGMLPLEYEFNSEEVASNVEAKNIVIGVAIPSAILLIACIVLTVKFRTKGFVSTFLQIGYIALLLLAIRYANVVLTIEGIICVGLFAVINYIFNLILLRHLKNDTDVPGNLIGKFALYTMPVYIIAIIFSFNSLTIFNSLGMTAVWGSICLYVYNLIITKTTLEMLSK